MHQSMLWKCSIVFEQTLVRPAGNNGSRCRRLTTQSSRTHFAHKHSLEIATNTTTLHSSSQQAFAAHLGITTTATTVWNINLCHFRRQTARTPSMSSFVRGLCADEEKKKHNYKTQKHFNRNSSRILLL